MRFYESRVEAGRNFLNKVWNATRFIIMNDEKNIPFDETHIFNIDDLKIEDKWIISEINDLVLNITENIEKYEFGIALEKIQKFVWEEFCDWYIEFKKDTLYNGSDKEKDTAIYTLKYVLYNSLKILHPFCPFITEEIYDKVFENEMLITSKFPEYNEKLLFQDEETAITYIKNVIGSIRNRRQELNVSRDKKPEIIVAVSDEKIKNIYTSCFNYIKNLASISSMRFDNNIKDIDKYIILTFDKSNIYIPFNELVDINKEKERIEKEIKVVESEISRAKGMLSNENFIKKAPKSKIDEEKEKLKKFEEMLDNLNNSLAKM